MSDEEHTDRPPLREVREWPGGLSWMAYPEEDAERASHALSTDAGVWLVDPLDAAGLDERVAELGAVTGVVVLQDRHTRDAVSVARRHDVAVSVPDWMALAREKLDTVPKSIGSTLPGTGYTVIRLIATDRWEEAALVDDQTGTMVVPEALGTLPSFGDSPLGVHPGLEEPPASLRDRSPDRILVGHGQSVHDGATAALETAVEPR